MQDSQISSFLTKIGEFELRIDISRQILAQNMNFSPLWLLQYFPKQTNTNKVIENNYLTIQHFQAFFNKIQFKYTSDEILTIFQYLDKEKQGRIEYNKFISFLLPKNRDSLKKIALCRAIQDIQMTISLKYSLRRLFIEILNASSVIEFNNNENLRNFIKINSLNQIQQLRSFMQTNEKFPTEKQLILISEFISPRNQQIQAQNQCQDQTVQKKTQLYQCSQNHYFGSKVSEQKLLNDGSLNNFEFRKSKALNRVRKSEEKQNDSLKSSNKLANQVSLQNKRQKNLKQITIEINKPDSKNLHKKELIPKLRIQRSESIISVQQKDLSSRQTSTQREQIKKAAIIAQKLLGSQCKTSRATSDQVEQSQVSQTQSSSGIRYPSKRRSQQLKESVVTLNPCSLSQVRQFKQGGPIFDSCI